MASHLLLATNVPFLCADLAMSMKEEKAISSVPSAKPDSSASKVRDLHGVAGGLGVVSATPIFFFFFEIYIFYFF
jgi:hypothetical protein